MVGQMERQAKDGTVYQQVGQDEWTPVTRTAKDGTVYKKMGADAWSPVEMKSEKPKESNKAEAALEGFGEGATLGYLNNIQAATEKPIFGVLNAITGQNVEADDYVKARDYYNRRQEKLQKENPAEFSGGQVVGTIVSSMPVAKAAQGATVLSRALKGAAAGAGYGAIQNTSEKEGEIGGLDLGERAQNLALGGAFGAGASLGADALAKGLTKGTRAIVNTKNKVGQYFKKGAEELAENATGATRVQAEKFRDGSGRYLLDNKIVSFGDTAENVAGKAGSAIKKSEDAIDTSLKSLDAQGVKVSQDKIVDSLKQEIGQLSKDPSKADVVKKLNSIIDDIVETGESEITSSNAEQVKRGFNRMAKNWQDPEKGQAGKIAYRAYRDAVEKTAENANQAIAKTFKEGKDTFGRLVPIVDAAEKRAKQLNQSPLGGLLDTAAVIGGAIGSDDPLSGGVAGLGAAMLRRKVSPRLASSMATTMDSISKRLLTNPQIAQVAQVNPEAFRATVFSLAEEMFSGAKPALKVADSKPTKGPDKWANDGIDMILKSDQADIDRKTLEKLKGTTKGKELLFEASTAKNKKAMENVIKKIRTAMNGVD